MAEEPKVEESDLLDAQIPHAPVSSPRAPRTTGKEDADEDTVTVPKSTLDAILKRLDKQDQELEVLRDASDQGRLSKVEMLRGQGKLVKNARLTTYDGKIAIGWKMTKDDVRFENDKLVEEQEVQVFFEDKTSSKLSYRSFVNHSSSVEGEVISESTNKDGMKMVTLQLKDGKEIEISTTFIN